MVPLVKQVMKQTRARIFRGDTHAEGKILSLFEPSTEIIRKGKAGKPNEFGKMVKLQEAEDQIVIDYEVYDRRPSDSDLLIAAIEMHRAMLGRSPHMVAADAAFYSAKNEAAAKAQGVKRVCIPNHSTKSPERKREHHVDRPKPVGSVGDVGKDAQLICRQSGCPRHHRGRLDNRPPDARRSLSSHFVMQIPGLSSVKFNGGYAQVSWVLTGESHTYNSALAAYNGIVPLNPFSLPGGGWGAWEIAGRISTIDLNDQLATANGVVGGRQTVYPAGRNWYVKRNVRFMFDYRHGDVARKLSALTTP